MPALYRKQLHFNFIGLFIFILMGSTYIIDRVVIFLIRPQVKSFANATFSHSNHQINAYQVTYLAAFIQTYYIIVFVCVALLLWLILSVFKNSSFFYASLGMLLSV
ncbi:hypothetical protein [Mucilaginibacter celer]|uniref:Uncharacterized protein n=1 Tax=Mucilaginibacter celer TaxID=2305508 RepID=A0A494VTJ5_9SPHI|nr:hypothetical protein [Mucilaginibacter celer]AYL94685.1 hypothetical protein HYN43_004970 [Mucilaginibacter celer]